MKTRIVAREHIAAIVDAVGLDALMDETITRITDAIRKFDGNRTLVRTRDGFHYTEPDVGLLEWMPVMHTAETTTIKVVGYHPSNPSTRNLPTILSTISSYDTATGHLAGLADGTFLTALRTGAASAIASQVLARPDSAVLGLIGCGAQAITQLHALLRTFPIEQVLISDVAAENMASFPDRAASVLPDGVKIEEATVEALLGQADIVCTSTAVPMGAGPLFVDQETRPWLHINAVGADFPGKTELPKELLLRAFVCPDHIEQAMKEGECQQLAPSELGPALSAIVRDPDAYREARDQLTVFDSTGWALQDRVALQMLLDHADRLDIGVHMHLEDISNDPLHPYDFTNGEEA